FSLIIWNASSMIRSDMLFLPSKLMRLIKRATRTDPYLKCGSGIPRRSRGFSVFLGTSWPPLFVLLRALGAVFGPALFAVLYAGGVERPAHNVIAHSRQIFHTAPPHEHNRVLLKVVADPRYIGSDFKARSELDARHFAQRGIR